MAAKANQEEDWKRIQIQTFTRWCNARLSVQKLTVEDLTTDFCDGVKLVVLLEVLSQKHLRKFNKKPRVYAQRMENVEIALQFITQVEKIRLVNIGSGDVVGGNLKLILGLVWTLILHYQISVGLLNTISNTSPNTSSSTPSSTKASESTNTTEEQSGLLKDKLLGYLKNKIQLPWKNICNITTDWNNGILIATLVDSTARGLCPECDEMVPENALQNATLAMTRAEDWLGVPKVLHPADIVNPNVDELSMMTYLSQFLTAKLKPGAPLKPTGNPLLVKVFGPGIQSEGVNVTMSSASFTIDTESAGPGKVYIQCIGPTGPVNVNVTPNGKHTYSCTYVPSVKGSYTMEVYFSRQPIPGSPFMIQVAPYDASKVKSSGPGLIGGRVEKPVTITFDATQAGEGSLSLEIEGPVKIQPSCTPKKPGIFDVNFKPSNVGVYVLCAKYGSGLVPGSPFSINVTNPAKVIASGTGVSGEEVAVGKKAAFIVDITEAGSAPIDAKITTPSGKDIPLQLLPLNAEGHFCGEYTPQEPGIHKLSITFDGEHIPKSPFDVQCRIQEEGELHCAPPGCILESTPAALLSRADNVAVSGCGIEGGILKGKVEFTVKVPPNTDKKLSVEIDGPYSCDVRRSSDISGVLYIQYTPLVTGVYNVNVMYAGKHVSGSPFHPSWTRPAPDASKCSVLGIKEHGKFTVDCKDGGGNGYLGIAIFGAYVPAENICVTHNGDYTFEVTYRIPKPGETTISVKWHDVHLKGSPFTVITK